MRDRLAALCFGLILSFVGLTLLEVALRIAGVGQGVPLHDPFAGFSATVPTFEQHIDVDGADVFRVARTRANPRRPDAVLTDPQRRFRVAKPADGFRVFVVGGSSAAGVPYGTHYAFSGWLERILEEALPDRSIEVVNAAFSGYATRRVLTVVREIAHHEPDFLIVYAGHNEFAEQRFFAHLIDLDPRIFRAWESLASLRIYQLLSRLLPTASPGADPPQLDLERDNYRTMEMFAALNERARGELLTSERGDAYRDLHYAFNLQRIVAAVQKTGGRVMLLSLGQNLSDWAPGTSSHSRDLSSDRRERFALEITAGDTARERGNCEAAIVAYRAALAIDASYAQPHFDLATCLRSVGEIAKAEDHYRRASDLDRVPHGAPSAFNDELLRVARETGALFVDIGEALGVESGERLVGDDLFLDMVHPNIRAHQLIAREVAAALARAGFPEPSDRWNPTEPLPSPEALLREDPGLGFLEAQIRLIACQLAQRPSCARTAADAMRALEPKNPITDSLSPPSGDAGRALR